MPILIFGYTPPDLTSVLVEFDLRQTVFSYTSAEILSNVALSCGNKIKVHLKIDNGMRDAIKPGMSK